MKDKLIDFKTAELAKEKGFKELCFYFYSKEKLQTPYLENGSSSDVDFRVDLEDLLDQHNNPYHNTFSAPEQSLLQKWLREIHNIHIGVWYSKVDKKYNVHSYHAEIEDLESEVSYCNSYEEALEKGLYESLTLIK